MKGLRIRALVLAAGRGERLRPLTDSTPKPLLPVLGVSILGRTLAELGTVQVEEAAINLCHLGKQIRDRLGSRHAGVPLIYSEEPQALGTSGALLPLAEFLSAADLVVVINGDTLCRWPLKRLVKSHLRRGAAATLLMTRKAEPKRFGGGVALSRKGDVLGFGAERLDGEARRRVFAGAHVFSPELLARLPTGVSDFVSDLYRPMLEAGEQIATLTSGRPWHDLGTPARYREGVLAWLRRSWLPGWMSGRSWREPSAFLNSEANIRRCVLESDSRVEANSRLEGSLLLGGAVVGRECDVKDSILGLGVELSEGSEVHRQLVTVRGTLPPPPGSSALGRLVFTPLSAHDSPSR